MSHSAQVCRRSGESSQLVLEKHRNVYKTEETKTHSHEVEKKSTHFLCEEVN